MKKSMLITVAAISAILFSFTTPEPAIWTLDTNHAKLGFSITHLMVSDVEGSFKMTKATVTSAKEDFSDAVVEMSADVSTVDTDNKERDNHLKSADFFEAEKFPTITFKSNSFKKVSDKKYKVTGNLTMHGVTKLVELDVTANTGVHPRTQKTIAGFKVSGTINRSDFGIASSMPSAALSDEVTIAANAEFSKN